MNATRNRVALAVASALILTGCGAARSDEAAPRTATQDRTTVNAGATYDGWIVRARQDNAPPLCGWSPDQVERMMEADQPLPACVVRLQRWFRENYDAKRR